MKKAYNLFSELPFIKLDNNEVKAIEKAIEICNFGQKFDLESCEEFGGIRGDFAMGKIYLDSILAKGNYYYYKKRKQTIESYSKYMRTVHPPNKKLKKEDK